MLATIVVKQGPQFSRVEFSTFPKLKPFFNSFFFDETIDTIQST